MTRHRVVIADPPWAYRPGFGSNAGVHGAVDAAYPTLPFSEIAALPVQEWAAPDAVLACWGTWPKLDEGIALVEAWGFGYVTGFPWIKTMNGGIPPGIGFWTQSVSEVVLIARRGEPKKNGKPAPVLGLLTGEDRQFWAPNPRRHSRKPHGLHAWLEGLFDGPYLELFARRPHPGWTCWGGDLGFWLTPAGVQEVARPRQEQPDLFAEASCA